ncbi:Thiamine-monophosphate kinase [hydrothermal vent metagenome]|uniref:Thiamine-monophosphate kinase n=1 Tax=hydrothermal vent metagenome TaxID=652676 RepID=A0A3B0WR98_9ZZZZ
MNGEFDLIKKYFSFPHSRDDVLIAAGDDCASVTVPENKQLLITTDTLISGVHFPIETAAEDIAYKAIMVNLSDLAAMGATPAWLTLAITLPEFNEGWLERFSQSFYEVLKRFNISLIGGDTTKGALSITIQAMGLCDKNKSLRRDKAKIGDKIYVTGSIGDAAIGLQAVINKYGDEKLQPCITRLNRPEARVEFAEALVTHSVCAIDISDGLVADLEHIVEASNCGAKIHLPRIPVSTSANYYFEKYNKAIIDWSLLLTQGDDYELCFTVNAENENKVHDFARQYKLKINCIGEIIKEKELSFINAKGRLEKFLMTGFKHF